MTDSDKELFELSSKVYELTKWEPPYPRRWLDVEGKAPLYTSDYLLQKLPPVIQDPHDRVFKHIQMWINGDKTAHAGYVEPYAHDDKVAYAQESKELRITLLKLTIALHKAGELK